MGDVLRWRRGLSTVGVAVVVIGCVWVTKPGTAGSAPTSAANRHVAMHCDDPTGLCTEVNGWKGTFDYYVGHDEPAALFYSKRHGSGNQMTYNLTLPRDPGNPTNYSAASTSNSYNMELHPAFWFGMAMCDTQSYPQQNLKTCTPDSDSNITPNTYAGMSKHAGTAFMEMQFYPPGDNHQPDAVNPCLVGQGPGDTSGARR